MPEPIPAQLVGSGCAARQQLIIVPCGARKAMVADGERIEAAALYTGPYFRTCLAWARSCPWPRECGSGTLSVLWARPHADGPVTSGRSRTGAGARERRRHPGLRRPDPTHGAATARDLGPPPAADRGARRWCRQLG